MQINFVYKYAFVLEQMKGLRCNKDNGILRPPSLVTF